LPSLPIASGGVLEVRIDGGPVWSARRRAAFPDSRELRQLVRDRIAPRRALGHSDERA